MRLSLVTGLVTAAAALAVAAPASAAPCTPTPFMQDGRPLTAQLVNPAAVTGTVDATGCDIAVYIDDGGSHTITNATIENAFYYGVLTRNPGTRTDISGSEIKNIGDAINGNFLPTGSQHGVGAAWREGALGSLDDSYVHHYQKNGTVVRDQGTSVDTTDSHVQGLGPVAFIAQNGVQYSQHSAGLVRNNLIEDNEYTGSQTPVAVGLLLYDVDPENIKRSLNLYRDNDFNELVIPSDSLK